MFYAQSTSTVISGRDTDRQTETEGMGGGGGVGAVIGARKTTILYLGSK